MFKYIGQKSEVGTVKGNQVRTGIMEKFVTGQGIMIAGAGIVIGIMIGTVDMIVIVIEIQIVPVIMIQEAAAGHARGQRNAPGIMIATGTCYILFWYMLLIPPVAIGGHGLFDAYSHPSRVVSARVKVLCFLSLISVVLFYQALWSVLGKLSGWAFGKFVILPRSVLKIM